MAKADSTAAGPAVPATNPSPFSGDQDLRRCAALKHRDEARSNAYGDQFACRSGAMLKLDADLNRPQRAGVVEYSVACPEFALRRPFHYDGAIVLAAFLGRTRRLRGGLDASLPIVSSSGRRPPYFTGLPPERTDDSAVEVEIS